MNELEWWIVFLKWQQALNKRPQKDTPAQAPTETKTMLNANVY